MSTIKSWGSKDPNELLDYGSNWTKQMTKDSDTLAGSEWIIESGTVTKSSASYDAVTHKTKIWLSGGEAGETCILTNRVTTTAGRIHDRSFKLKIKSSAG